MDCARNAILPDVPDIHSIIQRYAEAGVLLRRSLAELSENVRDFVVAEWNRRVAACGALHLYGMHLAEIRSIAVRPDCKGRGRGRAVVSALSRSPGGTACPASAFSRARQAFSRIWASRPLAAKSSPIRFTRIVCPARN